jgi:hypothetical protein
VAKPLRPDVERLLRRLQLIEVGGSDWVECSEARVSYMRAVSHHPILKEQGKVFATDVYTAITTPAFAPVAHLLKITRRV